MKNLKKIKAAKQLSKKQQKSLKGGRPACINGKCPPGYMCIRGTCWEGFDEPL